MAEHIEPNPRLVRLPEQAAIFSTFIGQAHIAGTGPEGKTCRECALWGVKNSDGPREWIGCPGHFSHKNKRAPGQLKRGGCHYEIRGKAKRRIPHFAPSCRFFQQADHPPVPVKDAPEK